MNKPDPTGLWAEYTPSPPYDYAITASLWSVAEVFGIILIRSPISLIGFVLVGTGYGVSTFYSFTSL